MFYYLKKWQIFISNEIKDNNIECEKIIESKIKDWVLLEWKIISYKETKEYIKNKEKMEEFSKNEFIEIIPKEPTNEEKLTEIENNLLILSSKITWLKQLIVNKLNTEDDLILLENLSLQAKELAGQRKTLKNTLLTNI